MSDRPIQVGDLVQVVREHCPQSETGGTVHTVSEISPAHPSFYLRCTGCYRKFAENETYALLSGVDLYHPLAWLRRIPPLSELEGVETEEGVKV